MNDSSLPYNFTIENFSIFNNLNVGILILKGNNNNEFFPIFCNDTFTSMSGLCLDDVKSIVTKEQSYCVHPYDIEKARFSFTESLKTQRPMNCHLRIKGPKAKDYKWFLMSGSVQFVSNDSFIFFVTFTNADESIHTKNILEERYKYLMEQSKRVSPNLLLSFHFNLTNNICKKIYKSFKDENYPVEDKSVDDFINSAIFHIEESKRDVFLSKYSRQSLLQSFKKGVLAIDSRIPIIIDNQQINWCKQSAKISRNPNTKDIECIFSVFDVDKEIRLQKSLICIANNDYEFVANLNLKNGYVRIISSNPNKGLPFEKDGFYHEDVLLKRITETVDEEFVAITTKALSTETIKAELKKNNIYTFRIPAKTEFLGHEGVYQWRFSYFDEKKEEVIFTRSELIGFLDKRQKFQKELTVAQQNANSLAIKAKSGLSKRNKILIADDSDINREMLVIIFENQFEILEACDGEEAIQLIDKYNDTIALILLDMSMPKKTGLDVLIHLKMRNLNNTIPTMLVTGSTSNELGLRSLEYGISDIVKKPYDSKIVKRRALNLIELFSHKEDVENQLVAWEEESIRMHKIAEKNNDLLINALSSVVEFRSIESGSHIKRVRTLTEIMLKAWVVLEPDVNLSDDDIEQIGRASTLHDIGKVAIPDNILLKPGRLTPEEFEIMKSHTTLGCDFLEQIKQDDDDFYTYCYDICRYHHERADGHGYPDGLTEDQIPFWAQIVSIVDVYDALISPRVYKAPFSSDKAIEMILNGECGTFSKRLLNCFEKARDEIVTQSQKMTDQKQQ